MANGDDSNSLNVQIPPQGYTPAPGGNALLLPAPVPNQLTVSAPSPAQTYASSVGSTEGTGWNRMGSPAYGVGQFMPNTWRSFASANPDMFKGMTPEQILEKRSDPEFGNKAIEWYSQQNAEVFKDNAIDVTGQNLRVAHSLGPWGAIPVLRASDADPMSNFLSPKAQEQNPAWAKMTVGQFKNQYANTPNPAWMGGPNATIAATSTTPAAADVAQPDRPNPLAMQPPPDPMDMKKMWAMMAMQSLLPKGFGFHPVEWPLEKILQQGRIRPAQDAPQAQFQAPTPIRSPSPAVSFGSGQGPSVTATSPEMVPGLGGKVRRRE